MFNFEPFSDTKEKIENLTQDLIYLRQDFIELQKKFSSFYVHRETIRKKA